ncbi:Aquaporin NIP6-1 [Forsythia ovata]|uniref:Aquaporin NIP6-1 n=1 Tax=Forsythia ovata TaxID=205694 RepID=A0ABD1QS73_9LAMI
MDSEDIASAPSTPVTPGTPGAPLFGGFKRDRNSFNGRKSSLLKSCKCFSVEAWELEEGSLPPVSCSLPPPSVSLSRKVGAEFIGTLILIFTSTATAIVNHKTNGSETLLGLAASTGLAVMVVILSTGHISGAHLNPSVTIAFAALKHFPWKHVPLYIGAQVMASLAASFVLKWIFDPIMGGGVTIPSGGYAQAFALELIITFNLMWGSWRELRLELLLCSTILVAGESTGASMNPVRTLGPAIAANNYKAIWVYLTAPILGALAGAAVYSAVKLPDEDVPQHIALEYRVFGKLDTIMTASV